MADSVFIEELRLQGKHGVHEHERAESQEFILDIRVTLDTAKAAASDNLEDTVDYGNFGAIAKEVVDQNSFYLIEKLGSAICSRVLEDRRIIEVSITIRKPAALKNGLPGVTISRTR